MGCEPSVSVVAPSHGYSPSGAVQESDLTLFSVDKSLCFFGHSSVVLQAQFWAKTDCSSHMSPSIRFKTCEDSRLCPVSYLKEYIARTEVLREGNTQLFLSPQPLHKPMKLFTLRQWILCYARRGSTRQQGQLGPRQPPVPFSIASLSNGSWRMPTGQGRQPG